MENLPAREVRRIVSKYNKELDIRGVSRMSKAAMIDAVHGKKPMDKTLMAKLTKEAESARGGKPLRKRAAKSDGDEKAPPGGFPKNKFPLSKTSGDVKTIKKMLELGSGTLEEKASDYAKRILVKAGIGIRANKYFDLNDISPERRRAYLSSLRKKS